MNRSARRATSSRRPCTTGGSSSGNTGPARGGEFLSRWGWSAWWPRSSGTRRSSTAAWRTCRARPRQSRASRCTRLPPMARPFGKPSQPPASNAPGQRTTDQRMSYSLTTLWYERQRYLPGVLAVGFSTLLIALQCGLLLGLFSITSIPIDHSRAHVWVGSNDVPSVDLGRAIPEQYLGRLASLPEVEPPEIYIQGFACWVKPKGGSELCVIMGSRLEDGSMGAVDELSPRLRALLTEPGTVVVDEAELDRLGIDGVGATAEIGGQRVRVVGLVRGLKSLAGAYIFCSVRTARPILKMSSDQTTYLLARCKEPADAPKVVQKLRRYQNMAAFTST